MRLVSILKVIRAESGAQGYVRRQNNLDEFGFRIAESLAHQG